ncbi:MAG: hypothetical protein EOP48_29650, partial [Sphingobacteriales bacterium]
NQHDLLGIAPAATDADIKTAFKRAALKWHPDRNVGIDTTAKMQQINEAKLILLDSDARERYNIQYTRYRTQQQQYGARSESNANSKGGSAQEKSQSSKEGQDTWHFEVDDEILKRWTANAKRQAVDLAKQTIVEFKGIAGAGIKAGFSAMGTALVYQIILSVIILIVIAVSKSC